MADFQQQVNISQALGKPGTIARLNPITKLSMVAEGSNVVAGSFVKRGTEAEAQVKVLADGDTAAAILGVAVFENYQTNFSVSNSLVINEGENVAVVLKGYVYIAPTTASTNGQGVYVNPETGEIQTGLAAPADFVDTGWKVETGNAANQPCEIYKI